MTLFEELKCVLGAEQGELLENEPLKNHCTFKIGGAAQVLFCPHSEKALSAAVKYAFQNKIPMRVLGNGSNVLISDSGLKGITLKIGGGLNDIIYLGDGVIGCAAGVPLTRLCTFALEKELTGLEFAYGIPGSTGGAVYMNAGAYGGEIKDVLLSVRSISPEDGTVTEEPAEGMRLSYRHTPFMTNGRIITAAYFKLAHGEKKDILEKMTLLMNKRKASQPLEYPSAGSAFKRPETGYAAAHIDECGLKGAAVGDAQVSTKHAGFIINTGNASCNDVLQLMDKVKQTVLDKHGVLLSPEVEYIHD